MKEKINYLPFDKVIQGTTSVNTKGKVLQVTGNMIHAFVPGAKVGELCTLINPTNKSESFAEVVGFLQDAALLTPLGETSGISSSTQVVPSGRTLQVPVGPGMLGHVLDGLGRLTDEAEKGSFTPEAYYPIYADPPPPMSRKPIDKSLSLGVRALDGLITCGEGQRLGIFAAAGGGKSTLLAQIIRNTEAEITVLALIGERGREVREFVEKDLGEEGIKHSVLVIATSDRSATERLKAAYVATSVAEYFRDQGKKVLLLMDSVTRFGRAQREIGLAAGEPPTRRGFPPSVFSELPKLMERAGQSEKGSITALYTVLVEGDDMTEPIADETRSILDGHIILSRKLASANHYPAIDILASISRVMNAIADKKHLEAAGKFRKMLAKYQEVEMLIRIGEYKKGNDPEVDEAIEKMPKLNAFLCQALSEKPDFNETIQRMINEVNA